MTVKRSKTSPGWIGRRAVDIARSACVWISLYLVVVAVFTSVNPAKSGTLLPNGSQVFLDNNGQPMAAGCVYFYVPGTSLPKATYQNAAQTVANTNPVQLDASGRAIIYGTGTYRQVVNAAGPNASLPCLPAGVQIWDQLTSDTSSSVTIYAGASSGTPNSIVVTAPAFSGTDGQVINYVSTNTNSAGATINPSGFGNIQIVRDSATGPGALTGGELVATNSVSLMYDATAGTFHILSPVTWPNTSGVPIGTVISVAGFTAPTNYAFAYGQAVSRTSFPGLLTALTSAQTGSLSSGSPTITGLSDITQLGNGQPVEAIGIPANTTISSCTGASCTMSANATATRSGTITFFAYGDGDGSTTFNLPDYRGVTMAGRDNMGNTAKGTLTSTYFGPVPTVLGSLGGFQSGTLLTTNLPPYTPSGTVQLFANGVSSPNVVANAAAASGVPAGAASYNTYNVSQFFTETAGFSGTPAPGQNSTPFSRIAPAAIINWAVRLVP